MFVCEFCGYEFDYEGIDDLEPLSDEGLCCESCYSNYVIPARMREYRALHEPEEDEDW